LTRYKDGVGLVIALIAAGGEFEIQPSIWAILLWLL